MIQNPQLRSPMFRAQQGNSPAVACPPCHAHYFSQVGTSIQSVRSRQACNYDSGSFYHHPNPYTKAIGAPQNSPWGVTLSPGLHAPSPTMTHRDTLTFNCLGTFPIISSTFMLFKRNSPLLPSFTFHVAQYFATFV